MRISFFLLHLIWYLSFRWSQFLGELTEHPTALTTRQAAAAGGAVGVKCLHMTATTATTTRPWCASRYKVLAFHDTTGDGFTI